MADDNLDGNGGKPGDGVIPPQNPSWYEGLPEDTRNNPSMAKFKDGSVDNMAKSYIELSSMIGKRGLTLPDENSTDAQKNEFYKALGRPDKAEGYNIKTELEVPKELSNMVSTDGLNKFKEKAHSLNISQTQASELYNWYLSENIDAHNSAVAGIKDTIDNTFVELKKEYGTNYDSNLALAKEVAESTSPELVELVGKDPAITKMLIATGKMMADDNVTIGGNAGPKRNATTIQSEINTLMGDRNGPLYERMHPEHKFQVKRLQDLHVELDKVQKISA